MVKKDIKKLKYSKNRIEKKKIALRGFDPRTGELLVTCCWVRMIGETYSPGYEPLLSLLV